MTDDTAAGTTREQPAAPPPAEPGSSDGGHSSAAGRYWYGADKRALLSRLRRIEGQVRGVHRMVEQDTYCIDILTQISAATRALQAVAVGLLEGHLAHCVAEAAREGDATAKVKEASDAIARLVRS